MYCTYNTQASPQNFHSSTVELQTAGPRLSERARHRNNNDCSRPQHSHQTIVYVTYSYISTPTYTTTTNMAEAKAQQEEVPNLNLSHITEGETERGIPLAKFIDDVEDFASSFQPQASAELLIGAYSDLMRRYRVYESKLAQKRKSSSSFGRRSARCFSPFPCAPISTPHSPLTSLHVHNHICFSPTTLHDPTQNPNTPTKFRNWKNH